VEAVTVGTGVFSSPHHHKNLTNGQILQSLLLTDEIRSIIDAETDFRIAYF